VRGRFWLMRSMTIGQRLDSGWHYRLEGHFARVVVEANLKLVEHSRAAEKIEPDTEALGESDRRSNLSAADLDRQIMNESRNRAAVANHDHLSPAALPVDADAHRFVDFQQTKCRPRVDKRPELMALDRQGNDGHQKASMARVGKFYSRHTISSSRGTRSTEGILLGSMSRALVSTSLPVSPTATSVSFTTATYLPAYCVTSSLKCSTIQRSSLSMIFPLWVSATFTIGPSLTLNKAFVWRS